MSRFSLVLGQYNQMVGFARIGFQIPHSRYDAGLCTDVKFICQIGISKTETNRNNVIMKFPKHWLLRQCVSYL